MIFKSIIVIALAITFKANAEKYNASDFAVTKNCSETLTIRTTKYTPYLEVYDLNDGHSSGISKARIKYKLEKIEINQTNTICCDGYQNFDDKSCIPVCTKSCGSEGICSSPEYCTCSDSYIFNASSGKCEPVCSPECINGVCISPNVCSCNEGYRMSSDNFYKCEATCGNETHKCTNLEFCAEPDVCRCIEGYARALLDRSVGADVITMCKPICDHSCINGECVSPNVCKCYENYTALDKFTCERVYVASNFVIQKKCSETKLVKKEQRVPYEEFYYQNAYSDTDYYSMYNNRRTRTKRISYRTEHKMVNETTSVCCDGYQNYDEESCLPVCSRNCGSHGICSKPEVCICNDGYSMDYLGNCQPTCKVDCLNGQCTSPNYCTCNDGYRKLDDYICEMMEEEEEEEDDDEESYN